MATVEELKKTLLQKAQQALPLLQKKLAEVRARENTQTATPATSQAESIPKPPSSNVDRYYQDLLKSMQPSKDERRVQDEQADAERELRNLNRGQALTNRNLADQPIAKGFITGQQNAVEQRYAIDRGGVSDRMQTLQQKLANLQARRQSAIDIAKTGFQYGQYQDQLAQQQYQRQLQEKQYQDRLKQQEFENQLAQQKLVPKTTVVPKTTPSSISPPTSSVPTGGYDSSQGTNYLTLKTNDLKTKAKQMFSPAFSTSLINDLTDEQLRLFLNDYTQQQNSLQTSLDPAMYLNEWKAAAGIGKTKTSSRSI